MIAKVVIMYLARATDRRLHMSSTALETQKMELLKASQHRQTPSASVISYRQNPGFGTLGKRAGTSNHLLARQPKDCEFPHHCNCKYIRYRLYGCFGLCDPAAVDPTEPTGRSNTHCNARWRCCLTGIGSALSQLWSQRTTSGSVVGVVSVFLYLANILVLHITTPALFAFETFNATWRVHVATRSLPTLDSFSQVNWTNPDNAMYVFSQSSYVAGSLYFLPSILGSNTSLGLKDGTLYDLVDGNSGVGNVTVDATGFNITCNYLRAVTINGSTGVAIHNISAGWNSNGHTVKLDGVPAYNLFPTRKMVDFFSPKLYLIVIAEQGIICPLPDEQLVPSGIPNFVDFYSTIPIMDSDNYLPEVTLNPPMDTWADPVSSIQIFRCSQSLVNQKAVVDAQTGQILSVEPNIHKTTSTWSPQIGQNSTNATDNVFMQAWHWLYNYAIPESTFAVDPRGNSGLLSVADLYLNQKLTLQRAGETVPRTVKLHDLENALSSIIASMYWTLGNIPPQAILVNTDNGTIQLGTSDADSDAPILHRGSAEVTEVSTQGRLDSDIIAVSAALRTTAGGLAASVALFLLSLRYSLLSKSHQYRADNPIDGTGILQAIWLYRNHPELETQLDQVDNPTEANLREAGMVRTRCLFRRRPSGTHTTGIGGAAATMQLAKWNDGKMT
ncbi:hypothetical protein B0H14DRAFT_3140380 [Mycena olivaceomarginata]|nr:hypothetical protein B0H14DRAFT_3140380 [Mycena olivaceomarginata]